MTTTDTSSSLLACNTHGVRLTAGADERCEDCRPLVDEIPLWPVAANDETTGDAA